MVARESLEHGYLPEGLNDVNAEIEAVGEVGKQRAEAAAWKLKLLMDQRPFMVEARKALSSLEGAHRNSFPGSARSGVGTDIARRLGDPANRGRRAGYSASDSEPEDAGADHCTCGR